MSGGHWCPEHEVKFFKKGQMQGYAHPIKKGEETIGWCNEPEEGGAPEPIEPSTAPKQVSGEERGMWWKELGMCLRSGEIDKNAPTGKALRTFFYAQMFSVLDFKAEGKTKAPAEAIIGEDVPL